MAKKDNQQEELKETKKEESLQKTGETENKEQEVKKEEEIEFQVNPNMFMNSTNKEIDYHKLIEQFGTREITPELLERFKKITGEEELHPFLRRGIFFSHRDLSKVLDYIEKGKKVYLYTGRGPSTDSMHLGHLLPFIFTRYLQKALKCPLVIQISDDEKFFYQTPKSQLKPKENEKDVEWFREIAIENIKDILACGFEEHDTFIFRNTDYMQHMYKNVIKLQRNINYNQIKGIFGLEGSENSGKIAYPAIQAAPCMSSSFPHIFGDKDDAICLIPCGIDQDPYFRMTRDIASKLKFPKPASIYSKFFPALQGWNSKMSSSDSNSAIFLTDTQKQIRTKINKAFSGGQEDIETHRKLGANLEVDIPYNYLKFFMEDDKEYKEIGDKYSKGELLTSEVKKSLIDILQKMIKEHQEKKKTITREIVFNFMKIRKM
jgi:tryptophanyl-tRNA synthetase